MSPSRRASRVFRAALALIALAIAPASADDRGDALAMLDRRTALRWGDDNLAWVVHYPGAFVDLWVKSEAARQRMTTQQEEAYRKSFSDELRAGSATAILLSVHAFGQAPLSLAPLSKNIALIDASGRRVSPVAFEKKLDSPLSGLMQGLVFFPLQESEDFSVEVKGLLRDSGTIFSFQGQGAQQPIATSAPRRTGQTSPPTPGAKETIVKIPSAAPPSHPKPPERPKSAEPAAEFLSDTGEIFPPAASIQPAASETTPALLRSEDENPQPAPPEPPKPHGRDREQTLESYLRAWADGDADRMYALLSTESKSRVSRELFARDVLGDGFRRGLRGGYRVDWADDSAQVTTSKRFLFFMRTLATKRIKFVEENGSSRVSW